MNTKYVTVFPGQGSQSVGMLNDFANLIPQIKQVFTEASEALGYDLWQLVEKGPEQELNQTEKTQPALLAAGFAIWKIWQAESIPPPAFMAGHSLGEYTALVCAEALEFKTAIKLVAARGKYMQEAVPSGKGAMAAIVGLDNNEVAKLCQQTEKNVSPANYNSIGQVVIAGESAAVQEVIDIAKLKGAKLAKLLPVSVPSHCILMKPAAEKLALELKNIVIKAPQIPVINNVDVKINYEPEEIKNALIKQLYMPVRWVEIIQFVEQQGVKNVFELGPGKVLNGLNKRISSQLQTLSINSPEQINQAKQWVTGTEQIMGGISGFC